MEQKIKAEKEQIQPTLRPFIDLRSGLLGHIGKIEAITTPGASENQMTGGRDLQSGPDKATPWVLEDSKERKESRREGAPLSDRISGQREVRNAE